MVALILWTTLVVASVLGQESNQVGDPWAGKGELSIYSFETQNGTIAKRELRNEAGQVARTIYYALSISSPARAHWPLRREEVTEDMLVPNVLEEMDYDEAGHLRWYRREGGGSNRTELIVYDSAGKKSHSFVTWKNSSGDSHYGTDYLADGRNRTIQADASGRALGFEGDLPDDLAGAVEWGEPSAGLAFSLSASPARGQQACLRFVLTIRNVSERERQTPLEIWPDIEVKDSRGRIVQQTSKEQEQSLRAARLRGGCGESSRGLRPREAYPVRDVHLSELYEGLTSGPYSATVRHCVGPNSPLASSNTVHFTIE
jgi:hypothetical protein